jgi:hypothetical protein
MYKYEFGFTRTDRRQYNNLDIGRSDLGRTTARWGRDNFRAFPGEYSVLKVIYTLLDKNVYTRG